VTRSTSIAAAVVVAAALCACGGQSSRFPSRPEGCDVTVFQSTPTSPTENIGPVGAHCEDTISKDECLRTLKDQVCKLGGDVVWGVPGEPRHEDGQWKLSGRAAHTK